MPIPRKAVFFNLESWGKGEEYIAASDKLKAANIAVCFENAALDKDHLPEERDFDVAGVFADSKVDSDVIASLPKLKFVAALSTGFDHIDIEACGKRGIAVSSVPNYGENTVAEFAFALILALSRKICSASRRVREEKKFAAEGLCGTDLFGKTIGVVGTGRIGKRAIRIAKGFGMNVIAYDIIQDGAFAEEMEFRYLPLEELLASSDIVTLHVPNLPATHHLINKNNIGLIKNGSYIINTARGAVIETAALNAALKSGKLGGAGLDVLEEEEKIKNGDMSSIEELLQMQNVIITPHNAFNSREAFMRILDTSIDNIAAFANGAPINLVKSA